MSLLISNVFTYDEDAGNYIQAVETADAQALEPATRKAINNFVIGCKQDGIWTAIKASCILAGARTLAGALVPLVGTAPTNNGFIGIGTDYVRKTGLVGDGSSKHLDSNRNNNADPQNNRSACVYATVAPTNPTGFPMYIGTQGGGISGTSNMYAVRGASPNSIGAQFTSASADVLFSGALPIGFLGASRSSTDFFNARVAGQNLTLARASQAPTSTVYTVYSSGLFNYSNARLAFYSIGESLDLARLDARVTDLINAFAVTIP